MEQGANLLQVSQNHKKVSLKAKYKRETDTQPPLTRLKDMLQEK